MKKILLILFSLSFTFLMMSFQLLHAEQVAIINSSNKLNNTAIKKILLAKSRNARLYFLKDTNKKNQFTQKYSGKSAKSINRKWQRLVFSGRAKPPIVVENIEEMILKVASDNKAIGHIDADITFKNPKIKVIK